MARIRTVKPDLFRHEGLFELEQETGLPIRLGFIGLFTCADREGRFKWRPRELALDISPYEGHEIMSRVLDALGTRGFLVKYASGHDWYGLIPSFRRHQVINNRESQSQLPGIEQAEQVFDFKQVEITTKPIETNDLRTRQPRDDHAPSGEGKGREGKGIDQELGQEQKIAVTPELKPKAQKSPAKHKIPDPFTLTTDMAAWARERTPAVNIRNETERFVNYWRAEAKTKADWPATWRNWMLKAQTDAERNRPRSSGPNFESTAWADGDLGI